MIKAGAMCSSSTNSETKLAKQRKDSGGQKYETYSVDDNAGDHQPIDGAAEEAPRVLNPFE